MIELYTWPTPNGQKVHIALEEMGLDYRVMPVDITRGEQFEPAFLEISPNNRIPAIVDRDGPGGEPLSLFESGAILLYLGEKSGRFLPAEARSRYRTVEWLMFQMGNVGPMFGQCGHFVKYAPERVPYAVERYGGEARRLLRVMDGRLAACDWLAGAEYTVADMATYPWVASAEGLGIDVAEYPAVARWAGRLAGRPAVERGMALLQEHEVDPANLDEEARETLFGGSKR